MKKRVGLILALIFMNTVFFSCLAQEPIQEESGFIELFNGEDLNDWVGNKESYRAEEGMIIVDPNGGGNGGNLFTENEYSDFVFQFEFQLTPGANNGLGIHAPLKGDAAYAGKEIQILDNTAEKYAELKPYQFHGSVYGIIPAERGFLKPVGDWNEQAVIVQGSKSKSCSMALPFLMETLMKPVKMVQWTKKSTQGSKRPKGT